MRRPGAARRFAGRCRCARRRQRGLYLFDPIATTWTKVGEPTIYPREGNSRFGLGADGATGALVGMGTITDCLHEIDTLHDGAIFDAATRTWTTIPDSGLFGNSDPYAGDTRYGITTFVAGGRYHGWGGAVRVFSSPTAPIPVKTVNFDDGASFDLATRAWTKMPAGGPSARFDAEAVTTDCDVVVYGGSAWGDPTVVPQPMTTLGEGMLFRP